MASSSNKVVLITGGNTGLGLEVVKALCRTSTSYDIVIGCRTLSKGDAAVDEVKGEIQTASTLSTVQVDLESDESLEAAVEKLKSKHGRLDVLINNSGAGFDGELQKGNMSVREAFNTAWDINVTGTHILTTLAVPLLLKSSDPRILFVTSGTASLTETVSASGPAAARINASPDAGWPKPAGLNPITSYRSSKTGLNMLVREWHRILKNDGVKVFNISPGFLATGLGGVGVDQLKKMGALDPSVGGEFMKDVVQGARDGDAGLVMRNGAIQPW